MNRMNTKHERENITERYPVLDPRGQPSLLARELSRFLYSELMNLNLILFQLIYLHGEVKFYVIIYTHNNTESITIDEALKNLNLVY